MLPSSILRQGAVSYITRFQFHDALLHAWPGLADSSPRSPTKLGIAISGGADSMSLAFLCHQLTVTHPRVPLEIYGFIVDHRARPESEDEAWKVKASLWKLGISSRILTLRWPTAPSKMKNFETQARLRRYVAMGKACAQMEIGHLLLGHHQDDNVETVLMRLAKGAVGSGLMGLQATTSTLPYCNNFEQVQQNRQPLSFETLKEEISRGLPTLPDADTFRALPAQSSLEFSNGGVNICRPLMPFTKSQLLSTCDFHRIPYQTDPTNFDLTLTPRNTIRALLGERKLPRALQAPSLLSLAEKKTSEYQDLKSLSKKLLQATFLEKFDLQCAILDVRPPSLNVLPSTLSLNQKVAVSAMYLRYLARLLRSPAMGIKLNQLEPAIPNIFPELHRPSDPPGPSDTFTACGLLWQRKHTELGSMWRIGCAPFKRGWEDLFTLTPPLRPYQSTPFFSFGSGSFWIQLINSSKAHLRGFLIRTLYPDDLSDIRGRLPPEHHTFLNELRQRGKFKFQLPVIAELSREERGEERKGVSEDGERSSEDEGPPEQEDQQDGREGKEVGKRKGRVICFPTFGLYIPNNKVEEAVEGVVEAEVEGAAEGAVVKAVEGAGKPHPLVAKARYRKLDLEVLRLLLQKPEAAVA